MLDIIIRDKPSGKNLNKKLRRRGRLLKTMVKSIGLIIELPLSTLLLRNYAKFEINWKIITCPELSVTDVRTLTVENSLF